VALLLPTRVEKLPPSLSRSQNHKITPDASRGSRAECHGLRLETNRAIILALVFLGSPGATQPEGVVAIAVRAEPLVRGEQVLRIVAE